MADDIGGRFSRQPSALQEVQRDELARAIRAVLATAEGRRVLFHILELAAIYRDPFGGGNDATNHGLGRQMVGRSLIAELDALDPRLYPTLLLQMAEQREIDLAHAQAIADRAKPEDDE
jgi:hypothetical protein